MSSGERMMRRTFQLTGTCTGGRCAGWTALNAMFSTTYDVDEALGTDYHERLKEWLADAQARDITVAGALTDTGITVLRNAAQEVADGLWVAAVDDVWELHADLDKALDRIPTGATVVLLAHEPDYADEVATTTGDRISLQLSGHSHGGQVRLPFVRPPALPYLAEKYHNGRYRVGRMWLYVNRGVGMIVPAVRLNCRPEVTLLTLRAS